MFNLIKQKYWKNILEEDSFKRIFLENM